MYSSINCLTRNKDYYNNIAKLIPNTIEKSKNINLNSYELPKYTPGIFFTSQTLQEKFRTEEEKARSFGVEADYGVYLAQAKEINKALEIAKNNGYLLPDKISCTEEPFKMSKTAGGRLIKCDERALEKYKDRSPEFWEYLRKSPKIIYIRPQIPEITMNKNKTELNPIFYTTLHELGHLNDFMCQILTEDPNKYFFNPCLGDLDCAGKIEKELGEHSLEDRDEFVANVFAKKLGQEPVSEFIQNLFNRFTDGLLTPYYWQNSLYTVK